MKYQYSQILLFLSLTLFIFSCEKLIELDVRNNAGMLVELEFIEGEDSEEFIIASKRFADFFPKYNMELKKIGEGNKYEVQLPTFLSPNLVGMLLGGKGEITLAPQVGDKLIVTTNQIADFQRSHSNGDETILIQLTDDYAIRWETMTKSNINKKITIIVDGMFVSSPEVRSPISVGKFTMLNENKEFLKAIYSLLKNPSDNLKSPKFTTKLFLRDGEGATELSEELRNEYYALQNGFNQNKYDVFQLIDENPLLEPHVKEGLKEDIGRMMDRDLGGYLGHNKFNLLQFQDVMRNARQVYDTSLSRQKVREEQRLREVKEDDGLPF